MKAFFTKVFQFLNSFFQFLDDKAGKFSFKRGAGVACLVTSIIFAFKGNWVLALIYLSATVVIAIVCAITGT
jgi:hypothetical protein